jgi:hypothetical protein
VNRTNPRPTANLNNQASGPLQSILSMLGQVDGYTATSTVTNYVRTVRSVTETAIGSRAPFAAGGPVRGPGTGTSDSIPALLSNNEHVWTAREVANAGGHAAVEALRAQFRYAAGGPVAMKVPPTPAAALSGRQWAALRASRGTPGGGLSAGDVDRIVRAIENNRGVSVAVSSREDLEVAMRALERELRQ